MSLGSGFAEHASDEKYLPNENGARMGNSSKRLTVWKDGPVNRSALENERNTAPTSQRKEADDSGEPAVCCSARVSAADGTWRQWSAVGVVVVVVAVLFGACFCALLIHVDGRYASEVAGLRQELRQLRHLCHLGKAPSPGGSAGEASPGTAAHGAGADELLWNPHGPLLAGEPESFQNAASVWGQDRQADDDHDDDDDEGYDDTDVGQSGENDDGTDGMENRADERFLHRMRRAAEKARKKQNWRSCRKYHRCKKAQGKGKRLKKACEALLACPEKAQDKSKPLDRRCQSVMACLEKEKPSDLQTSKMMQPPSPGFLPLAVHFFSSDSSDVPGLQKFGQASPLKFPQAADWMRKLYKDQSEWPIQNGHNGTFLVKRSGLYLVYSSVMYHDLLPRQSHAVVVNGQRLFRCMESVDYVDLDLPSGNHQSKYKTCTMTGVTHLAEADRLEVQNLYARTEIALFPDSTYFGAVLLSPGPVADPRSRNKTPEA